MCNTSSGIATALQKCFMFVCIQKCCLDAHCNVLLIPLLPSLPPPLPSLPPPSPLPLSPPSLHIQVVTSCDRMVNNGQAYVEACRSFSSSVRELAGHFHDNSVVEVGQFCDPKTSELNVPPVYIFVLFPG